MTATVLTAGSSFQMVCFGENHKAIFPIIIYRFFAFRVVFVLLGFHESQLKTKADTCIKISAAGCVAVDRNEIFVKDVIDRSKNI
jgi:hypothetical protein